MLIKICEGKSIREISKELNIPVSTLYYKIRKLKEIGVIKERVEIDWEKIGYKIRAIVLIETENMKIEEQKRILERIKEIDGILWGKIISGKYDIAIEIVSKDLKEFSKKLDTIKGIPGIKRTESYFVLGDES